MKTDEIRNGSLIDIDGAVMQVIEFSRKSHSISIKMKNYVTKEYITREFDLDFEFKSVTLQRSKIMFSGKEGNTDVFMDDNTFELYYLDSECIPSSVELDVSVPYYLGIFYNNELITVEPVSRYVR